MAGKDGVRTLRVPGMTGPWGLVPVVRGLALPALAALLPPAAGHQLGPGGGVED